MLNITTTTPLHMAAQAGDDAKIMELLREGADSNVLNYWGNTALHVAISYGHIEAVKALITVVQSATEAGYLGDAIHQAARWGRADIVKVLLDAGANVNQPKDNGSQPLHLAASAGNADCVQALLDAGAYLTCADHTGKTPAHEAVIGDNDEVLALLIKAGINLYIPDRDGKTALHMAADLGCVECFNLMVGMDSFIAVKDMLDNRGWSPLRYAAFGGHTEIVEALLANECSVNRRCKDERHILHDAVKGLDNGPVILALLEAGAEIEAVDDDLMTPLHAAVKANRDKTVRMFLDAGADVDAGDKDGATPLHHAVFKSHPEVVKALLDGGADVDAVNSHGCRPGAMVECGYLAEEVQAVLDKA